MKKEVSFTNLINMNELNKVIKKADCIIWENIDGKRHLVSDTYFFAVIEKVECFSVFSTLTGKFETIPQCGSCMTWRKNGSSGSTNNMFEKFTGGLCENANLHFTELYLDLYRNSEKFKVALYKDDHIDIIRAIDEKYHDMIVNPFSFCPWSIETGKNAPLLFGNSTEEMFYVCPINTGDNPTIEKLCKVL